MTARKTSAIPTRIWSFHARQPVSGEERVRSLLRLSGAYYNRLIEIERERIREYQETRRFYAPELVELEEREADLLADTTPDRKDRLKAHRAALREARRAFEATLGPARAELKRRRDALGAGKGPRIRERVNASTLEEMLTEEGWPDAWKDLAKADNSAHEQAIAARSASGISPGCYLLVEAAVTSAIRDSRPAAPRFRSFATSLTRDGDDIISVERTSIGRVGVQLTPALSVPDLFVSRDNRLRLRYCASDARQRTAIVSLRVGSNDDRSPIWAEFPCLVHRPLPEDAIVKWAWVKVSRHAGRLRYELQLTLEAASFGARRRPWGDGWVEFSAGCEARADGSVVVGAWRGHDDRTGEIALTQPMVRRLRFPEQLESAAEKLRNDGYRVLNRWLRLAEHRITGWERCSSDYRVGQIIALARTWARRVNHGRQDLWSRWRDERRAEKKDLYVSLPAAGRWLKVQTRHHGPSERLAWWIELWSRKYEHLRRMEADVRLHGRAARDQFFADAALDLRDHYGELRADTLSLVPTEQLSDGERSLRQLAAPGELRATVRERFGLPRSAGTARNPGNMPEGPHGS